MGSSQQGIYSTPIFELFRRGLITQTIKVFRGLNVYSTISQLGPEFAQDLNNVIVSGSGGLSKLRLPVKLSAAIAAQNFGPFSFWDFQQGNGTRQVLAQFAVGALYYFTNDLANVTLIEVNPLNIGMWSFVLANNFLFGANGQRMQKWTGANWWTWGQIQPPVVPTNPTLSAGNLSPQVGYTYTYAFTNSVTSHTGNISLPSGNTGAQVNQQFQTQATAPADPQIDTITWFRTLDGGGDQFKLCDVNINTGAVTGTLAGALITVPAGLGNLAIIDNTPDSSLDQTKHGPLINNPPIQGKYLATGQGRIGVFNLVGAPQDFIYSGYEQIFIGRPEESFPPSNRIRLSIGAEQIAGAGILQAGVVAFSNTGKMFMLRGTLEDITLAAPVVFSEYMEELPWTLGCMSHFTIQSTPYGLIWLAGDKTVQMFDGSTAPMDISTPIYPLLRSITPGTESNCISGYFNWLERDWYVLVCAVNGSLALNRAFFFAFNKQPQSSTIESIECFISDLPGTFPGGGANWIGIITTSKLQRMLCVGAGGFIQQIPVSSTTVSGLTQDQTITPATNGLLGAYWRGGYFGNDAPQRSKMWRFLRMISDQPAQAFKVLMRYVDDEQRTFMQPELQGPFELQSPRLGLNWRAKRAAPEIQFPPQDVDSSVIELQMAHIPTSDR